MPCQCDLRVYPVSKNTRPAARLWQVASALLTKCWRTAADQQHSSSVTQQLIPVAFGERRLVADASARREDPEQGRVPSNPDNRCWDRRFVDSRGDVRCDEQLAESLLHRRADSDNRPSQERITIRGDTA